MHQGMQCTWYCSDDDKFCCSACKDSDHRACVGLKQVVSDRSYGQQKQSLVRKSKRGEYSVKIKNRLTNRGDNDKHDCDIVSICVLPDGNILVLDYNNSKLKKLDSSYNLVSYCNLPYYPVDICYIGNDTAVISIGYAIQYVNVSGSMKLLKEVKVGHGCYGMTCHGDTLYVTDEASVYTYNKDCQQRRVLYRSHDLGGPYLRIAVSDDGEIIYITVSEYGLITIDNKGTHLFTLKKDVLNSLIDICVADDDTVLVSDASGNMLQVDYRGEQILETVLSQSDGLYRPQSLCYDRKRCRIIVVGDSNDYISVYDLQFPSDVTNVK